MATISFSRKTAVVLVFGVAAVLQGADSHVKTITILKNPGGRVDWGWAKNVIAYDRPNGNYYEVYTMNPDGSNEVCLTCNKSQLPSRHKGNPTWDPTGQWIAFQAEKGTASSARDILGSPGIGENNDLWVMDSGGNNFYRLTDVTVGSGGVLHPQFSHKGDKLFWAEQINEAAPFGTEVLKVADFSVRDGVPGISNVQSYTPGNKQFYESHGWSRDDSKIYFASDPDGANHDAHFMDVYAFNLSTGTLLNLSNDPSNWDELPTEAPTSNMVTWMSTSGNPSPGAGRKTISDLWIMNPDGSSKLRMTYFNAPGQPESNPGQYSVADMSWSKDGYSQVVLLNINPATFESVIARIDFDWTSQHVSAASYQPPLATGAIATAFGRGLAPMTVATPSTNLPVTLANTTVTVKDSAGSTRNAPLLLVSPEQVNYVVPDGTSTGQATVTVTTGGIVASTGTIQVGTVAPAIFTANASGQGVAAAYVQHMGVNTAQTTPLVFQCDSNGLNCTSSAIDLGGPSDQVFLDLFATGVRGAGGAGAVTVSINGKSVPVLYAGPQNQYPGLDQIVVAIPRSLAGAGQVNVTVSAGGLTSNTVQVSIR